MRSSAVERKGPLTFSTPRNVDGLNVPSNVLEESELAPDAFVGHGGEVRRS